MDDALPRLACALWPRDYNSSGWPSHSGLLDHMNQFAVPRILTDEIADGAVYRQLRFNGFRYPLVNGGPSRSAVKMLEHASDLFGLSHEDVAYNHSTWALNLTFLDCYKTWVKQEITPRRRIRSLGNSRGQPQRLCRSCVEEQLDTFSFAAWNRKHQVPGVAVCTHHGEPLFLSDAKGFKESPARFLNTATPVPIQATPTVARYAQIVSGLMSQQSEHTRTSAVKRVCKYLEDLLEPPRPLHFFYQLMGSLVPNLVCTTEDWNSVSDCMVWGRQNTKHDPMKQLIRVIRYAGSTSAPSICWLAALVFDDYRTAINVLLKQETHHRRTRSEQDEEAVFKAYLESNGQLHQISSRLGASFTGVVRDWLVARGIPRIGSRAKMRAAHALFLIENGMSLEAALRTSGSNNVQLLTIADETSSQGLGWVSAILKQNGLIARVGSLEFRAGTFDFSSMDIDVCVEPTDGLRYNRSDHCARPRSLDHERPAHSKDSLLSRKTRRRNIETALS